MLLNSNGYHVRVDIRASGVRGAKPQWGPWQGFASKRGLDPGYQAKLASAIWKKKRAGWRSPSSRRRNSLSRSPLWQASPSKRPRWWWRRCWKRWDARYGAAARSKSGVLAVSALAGGGVGWPAIRAPARRWQCRSRSFRTSLPARKSKGGWLDKPAGNRQWTAEKPPQVWFPELTVADMSSPEDCTATDPSRNTPCGSDIRRGRCRYRAPIGRGRCTAAAPVGTQLWSPPGCISVRRV